jgi:hypothetical protein
MKHFFRKLPPEIGHLAGRFLIVDLFILLFRQVFPFLTVRAPLMAPVPERRSSPACFL